jgi:hypothetical protein
MWNTSATHGLGGFLAGYVLIGIPVFAMAVALALWSRKREGRLIAAYLPAYVESGWLEPAEATMLASLPLRRAAREWAATAGPAGERAMAAFQQAATELAFLRDRAAHGSGGSDFGARERQLLGQLTAARITLERLDLARTRPIRISCRRPRLVCPGVLGQAARPVEAPLRPSEWLVRRHPGAPRRRYSLPLSAVW